MTPDNAQRYADAFNIPLDCDFHALDADTVQRIIAAADAHRYRKPRNANGSRARYFHALLRRRTGK